VQTQAEKSPSLLPWIMTATVMLLTTAGFAALVAGTPFLTGASRDSLSVSPVESAEPVTAIDAATLPVRALARLKAGCEECGVIESIRETQGHDKAVLVASAKVAENQNRASMRSGSREITVRLEDGSSRVIVDSNPGTLRLGERVKVIDGIDEPDR
jgi:hypothetical protein